MTGYFKRGLYFFTIGVLILLFTGCFVGQTDREAAVGGELDLRGRDFRSAPPLKLAGQWAYYWEEFYSPAYFAGTDIPQPTGFMNFPDIWNSYIEGGRGNGFLTYRLKIKVGPQEQPLAIYLHDINTAYTMYINGKRLITRGKVGRTRRESEPLVTPATAEFYQSGETLEIVMHVSNFHHRYGGPRFDVLLGSRDQIYRMRERNLFADIFLFGGLMIIAIYHMVLYLLRKKDRAPLYILISCILISLRTLLLGEMYFNQLFPFVEWEYMLKIEFIGFFMVTVVFSLLVYNLSPNIYNRWALYLLFASGSFCSLFVLVAPIYIGQIVLPPFQIITVLYCFYTLYVLIVAFLQKSEGSLVTLLGYLFFFGTIFNDFLYSNTLVETGFVTSYGLYLFVLSQAVRLSIRFSKAFNTAEHLTKNLKQEVRKRTEMLKKETRKALDAKEQMEEMNRQKSNFFMNLTHETKTPVTLIKNYLEMHIAREGMTRELKIVARNTGELERNMDNYMQIERADEVEGGLYRHETVISLTGAIEQLCRLYPSSTIESRLKSGVYIKANPAAIKRALDNILINAIKYNDEDVKIEIELSCSGEQALLRIADNGVGIPEEQLDNIFNPFYQLSHKKRNVQGVGLGLSLVKRIFDSLEAPFEVKSGLGRGLEYRISLPTVVPTAKELKEIEQESLEFETPLLPESEPEVNDGGYSPLKETVMVVEDKRETLGLLKGILEEEYNVIVAENGEKALLRLNELETEGALPSLILSDIMMDCLDGFAFIDSLKSREAFCYIPVVLLSAKSTEADQNMGYSKGAVAYLTKPFSPKTLKAVISANIESRELLLDDAEKSRYNERAFMERCNELGISALKQQIVRYWLVDGLSQEEIGVKIGRSRRMVEKHIGSVKKLTATKSKKELRQFFSELLV